MKALRSSAHTAVRSLRIAAVSTAIAWLAAACGAAPASAASCPQSELDLSGYPFTSNAVILDTTVSYSSGDVYSSVGYDLVHGTLRVHKSPSPLAPTYVITSDAYDVVGVPPGTPVTVTAEIVADGAIWTPGCGASGCHGTLMLGIHHGSDNPVTPLFVHLYAGRQEVHGRVSLPVTIVAGTAEVIGFELRGYRAPGGHHGVEGMGHFFFTGLPPGAVIVSRCGLDSPVPTRSISWGRLKTTYR